MSLPHALLGLLSYRPETGYDLKARFEHSIHFFWNATLPQIYRTLNQMKDAGWLQCTIEHQDGKPNRKVYSLTEAGKVEFSRWMASPPEHGLQRETFMIKVFFGRQLGAAGLAAHVRGWRDHHQHLLQRLEHEAAAAISQYSGKQGLQDEAPYWTFTLDFGIRQKRALLAWCDQTLADLERLISQGEAGQ